MADEDDLAPSTAPGYKVGEKKTLDELANLDAQDESLRKWKESLGIGKTKGGNGKPVEVLSLALEVDGRTDVVMDVSTPQAIEKLKGDVLTIKEGIEYRLKISFKVNNDVISGLKYLQVVKKMGIRVDKMEEMVGSYGPQEAPYTKKFPVEEAPSGMLARGTYQVKSKFIDDDKVTHLEWEWSFAIKKDWE
ncbi:immunoglobulin E-set [Gorgonomyces haynaldii]|nr:immunoglobulin E-set [Gorgonomyces haynaldii]